MSDDDLIRRGDVLEALDCIAKNLEARAARQNSYGGPGSPTPRDEYRAEIVRGSVTRSTRALPADPHAKAAKAAIENLIAVDNFCEGDFACEKEWQTDESDPDLSCRDVLVEGDDDMCAACGFRDALAKWREVTDE